MHEVARRRFVFVDMDEDSGRIAEFATVFSDFAHSHGRAVRIVCVRATAEPEQEPREHAGILELSLRGAERSLASALVELLHRHDLAAEPTIIVGLGVAAAPELFAARDALARGSLAALLLTGATDRDLDPDMAFDRMALADAILFADPNAELLAIADAEHATTRERLRIRALGAWASWPVPANASAARRRHGACHALQHRIAAGELDAALALCRDLSFLEASTRARGSLALARELGELVEAHAEQLDQWTRGRVEQLQAALLGCSHWLRPDQPTIQRLIWERMFTQTGDEECLRQWFRAAPAQGVVRQLHPLSITDVSRIIPVSRWGLNAVACAADGTVVAAGLDGMRAWDSTDRQLWSRPGVISCLAIQGRRLISAGSEGAIWDLDDRQEPLLFFPEQEEVIRALVARGDQFYVGYDSGRVSGHQLDSGRQINGFQAGNDSVDAIAITSAGAIVVACGTELIVESPGHVGRQVITPEEPVTALVALADGSVVCGYYRGRLHVWWPERDEYGREFHGHEDTVTALAVGPHGQLISVSDDQTMRIWDLQSGCELACLRGHADDVRAVAVTESGSIVSGSLDGTVRIWPPLAPMRDDLLVISAGLDGVHMWWPARGIHRIPTENWWQIAVSSDGRVWAAWSDEVTAWGPRDLPTTRDEDELEHHSFDLHCVQVWAVGEGRLASGGDDGSIVVWDLHGDAHQLHELHGQTIEALTWTPSGMLVSAADERGVQLWDPRTGEIQATLDRLDDDDDDDDDDDESFSALAVLANEEVLVAAFDSRVWAWDPKSGAKAPRLAGHDSWIGAIELAPGGRVVTASADHTVRAWDPITGEQRARFDGHSDRVKAVAVTADGCVISGSEDRSVRVWDLETGEQRACLRDHRSAVDSVATIPPSSWPAELRRPRGDHPGHRGSITGLAWHPNGQIISASADDTLRGWSPASGRHEWQLEIRSDHPRDHPHDLALSSQGLLVTTVGRRYLRVHSLEQHKPSPSGSDLVPPGDLVRFALGPDDRIITSADDGLVRIWDFDSRTQIDQFAAHQRWIHGLAISSAGLLITAGDRMVRAWDLTTKTEQACLDGLDCDARTLAAASFGRMGMGNSVGVLKLWDPASSGAPSQIRAHAGAVEVVAWADAGLLVSGGADMSVRAWHPTSGQLFTLAYADAPIRHLAIRDELVVAGDGIGNLWFLAVNWDALTRAG